MRKTQATFLLTAGLLGLALAGCTPIVATRGNMPDENRLAQIQPGQSSREQVQYVLGSPTSTGTLDPNTWYYIGRVTAQTAFFDPEVTDQKIVRVRFDDQGLVSALDRIDGSQAEFIDPVERVTPTVGHNLGFFEQLLGNLGQTPKKKDDKKKKKGG
ncbi:outer membrane protein assembly factor BamE [Oleisolibacter albus]|uniref:outer membrane protein assembly factor BamE n=1 Tax=Oleisolibacter albus TaxID=2171757 RepID=UPI000DF2A3DB|nr:outer membrane protein assembly factor BamE [Oleisolibacter albus]